MDMLPDIEKTLGEIKSRYHYRLYMDGVNKDIGTYASGNWGHHGLKGQIGGSSKGGGLANRGSKLKDGTYTSKAKERAAKAKEQASKNKEEAIKEARRHYEDASSLCNSMITKFESRLQQSRDAFDRSKEKLGLQEKIDDAEMTIWLLGPEIEKLQADTAGKEATIANAYGDDVSAMSDDDIERKMARFSKRASALRAEIKELEDDDWDTGDLPDQLTQVMSMNFQYSTYLHGRKKLRENNQLLESMNTQKMECQQRINKMREEAAKSTDVADLAEEYDKVARERDEQILKIYTSANDCSTAEEVTDYLRAKNVFRERATLLERDAAVNLSGAAKEVAIGTANHVEKLVADYPNLKGKFAGITLFESDDPEMAGCYAYADQEGRVALNKAVFGDAKKTQEEYQKSISTGHHPSDTDYLSIIDHELTHQIENVLNNYNYAGGRVSDMVMQEVVKRMNSGVYDRRLEQEARERVSGYAANNDGIRYSPSGEELEDPIYGRNTEFLAEGFSAYRANGGKDNDVVRWTGEEMEKMIRLIP